MEEFKQLFTCDWLNITVEFMEGKIHSTLKQIRQVSLKNMVEIVVIKAKRLVIISPLVSKEGVTVGEPLFSESAITPVVADVVRQ